MVSCKGDRMVGEGVFLIGGRVFIITYYHSRVQAFLAVRLAAAYLCGRDVVRRCGG